MVTPKETVDRDQLPEVQGSQEHQLQQKLTGPPPSMAYPQQRQNKDALSAHVLVLILNEAYYLKIQ